MIAAITAGCVCALMGMGARRALQTRVRAIECWLDALHAMELELQFARLDLCTLLTQSSRGEDGMSRELNELLSGAADRMRNNPDCGLTQSILQETENRQCDAWRALHELDRACLLRALHALEQGTSEERAEHVRHARKRLSWMLEEARRSGQQNGRMYASLGWLGGVALVLLLA